MMLVTMHNSTTLSPTLLWLVACVTMVMLAASVSIGDCSTASSSNLCGLDVRQTMFEEEQQDLLGQYVQLLQKPLEYHGNHAIAAKQEPCSGDCEGHPPLPWNGLIPNVSASNESYSGFSDPWQSPIYGVMLHQVTLKNTGMTLRVATAGPPGGIPVLFMHGYPESWYSWRHQLVALGEEGYYAIAPDMRGYGYSDAPAHAADYNVHAIASDMIGLLQELNLSKANLIGHDWGAVLCWLLGRLYPQYFPTLAALSVPTQLRKNGEGSFTDLTNEAYGTGPDRLFWYMAYNQETFADTPDHGPAEAEYDANVYATIRILMSDKTVLRVRSPGAESISSKRRDGGLLGRMGGVPQCLPKWLSEEDFEYFVEQFKHHGFRGGVNYYRNIDRNHKITPQLVDHLVEQPCFFLTGVDDLVVQFGPDGVEGQEKRLRETCRDVRSFVVLRPEDEDGKRTAGHWIQQERPADVNYHLLKFLKATHSVFEDAPGVPPPTVEAMTGQPLHRRKC